MVLDLVPLLHLIIDVPENNNGIIDELNECVGVGTWPHNRPYTGNRATDRAHKCGGGGGEGERP